MSNVLRQLNDEVAGLVDSARHSLVRVSNGRHGAGAGTIWHPDGLVITNAHVVGNGPVRVGLPDGRVLPARLLAQDTDHDLASLRIDANGLPTVAVGDSKSLRPGQWVSALGHPWGVVGALTTGVVIGIGAEWPEIPQGRREWVLVNLHLRPGHSGGPLVDAHGRLVGINTIMVGPDIGGAVPVHVVKAFLRQALGSVEPVSLN
ncbi:MAG: trypsin-like peptidase domain-containing protein [Anaerolineae bacterium]|nr:trypsin-like peptidase domain-containing protein [Anaerolineae bacterium]